MRGFIQAISLHRRWNLCLVIPVVTLGLACRTQPSDKLLEAFRQKEQQHIPGIMVIPTEDDGTLAFEEVPYNGGYNNKLREVMEVLGNDLGFRVEMHTRQVGSSFMRLTLNSYRVVSLAQKTLPGLTITQDGALWTLHPDFKDEVVIEKAVPAEKGIEQWEEESHKADFQALKGELLAESKADAAKKVEAFQVNVARIQKDLNAKHAWWVEFRHRPSTTLPSDSPLWKLTDALIQAPAGQTQGTNSNLESMEVGLIPQLDFFKTKGQINLKDNLQAYICVLFEGADGSLIKAEGFQTFLH